MDLADVVTLQRGITAPRFQLATQLVNQPDLPERSFSLITADGRSLDLIASSINIAEEWFKCLNFLIFDIYTIREDLYKVWCLIVTGEGIKEEVDDLDILDEIIDDSIKEDLISIRNFALYWNTIQDPRFPPHHILQDIDKCLPGLRVTCEYFTFQAFFCLISSFENNAFDPCRLQVYQEMTHPLSHYFINSSDHINVISKAISSEDYLFSYQTDLVNGCRAIELHCWDGINSPIVSSYVRHCNDPLSSTSTVEVSLEKVLEVIQKYAFVTSPYPLFLFIENHCSLHIQEMIAYYLLATFGDKIVPANEISYGSDDFGRYLPSPNDLYEKVIVVISDTRHNYKTPLEEDMLDKKSLRPISSQLLSYGEDEIKSEINHQRDSLPQVQSTSTMGMGEVKVILHTILTMIIIL